MPADQPAKPKRKLRWYQFSLRTLLIVVTLFGLACSWFAVEMNRARRQRQVVEAVERTGGSVDYEYESEGIYRVEPHGPAWMREMLGIDFFNRVDTVSFGSSSKVADFDLSQLETVNGLRLLDLSDGSVSDADLAGLENLKGLKRLNFLCLNRTNVTNAGLEHVKDLSQLQVLFLSDTRITDAGLVQLQKLSRLERLYLSNTQITNAGIAELQRALPNCEILRSSTLRLR